MGVPFWCPDVCREYPRIVEAGLARDWAWIAHGKDNSTFQSGFDEATEAALLADVVGTLRKGLGRPVHGWLGPALTETFATPRLLARLGLSYVLDWCNDDQPYPLREPGMISVPYSIELNDVTLFVGKQLGGADFYRIVCDQFDQLWEDGARGGRVMALCLHPFIVNQPFRHKYLVRALDYIAGHADVWLTTSDDIAAHYRATREPAAARGRDAT